MALRLLSDQVARKQSGGIAFQCLRAANAPYSTGGDDAPRQLKTTNLASLKRGTGGRSSFNGLVVTIFGSTGFLGSYVANRFGKIGSQLINCYRGDFYPTRELKVMGDLGQVLFHFYNLRDEDSIREAVKYSNVVVNLVGRNWETRNFNFNDVHVDGARRIARICREEGVDRLIHLSAMNVTPNPKPIIFKGGSKFLKSKYYGELAVMEEFPNATIIRPSEIYGSQDHFCYYYGHFLRRQNRILSLWHKGERTIKAPVFAADVAQAIVNAAQDPDSAGKIYQGVGPNRYLLSEIVDYMFRIMRRDAEGWGYIRNDMRFNPLFFLQMWLNEKITFSHPVADLHRERVEREHISDIIDENLPTLEDLGIELTHMEDQLPWEMKMYSAYMYYTAEPGEYDNPQKPAIIGPRDDVPNALRC